MIFGNISINVFGIHVNSIDNSSFINIGPNQTINKFTSYNRVQNVGEQNGDTSPINLPQSSIPDSEITDGK
ncbi:hypothetical protein ABE288_27890 [Bacillus salipaludis]|uniref:hypothetical protein n=1 Tax=Bacillus salipaludis TaxID=2547811 RepID=UPI003D1A964A